MKEQEKSPGKKKGINEMEASNLPDVQFKAMLIRCSRNLGEEWMKSMRV